MPAAKKPPAKTEQQDSHAVYALVHILPGFAPGDRIDEHFTPEVLELIISNGDASRTKPKASDVTAATDE